MAEYLIIDGYNIISKWPDLAENKQKNIEFARQKLNNIIQKYIDYKGIKVTIVYDGAGPDKSIINGSPEIIFSKGTESADSIIESLVYNHQSPEQIIVATDDNIQRNFIVTAGAWYVSANDLETEVAEVLEEMRTKLS